MDFPFDQTSRLPLHPISQVPEQSTAGRMLMLSRSLTDWFGQPPLPAFCDGEGGLRLSFPNITLPTVEWGESFGPLAAAIREDWPLLCLTWADSGEVVSLSTVREGSSFVLTQTSASGHWREQLRGLTLCASLPTREDAACMAQLTDSLCGGRPGAALSRFHAPFLLAQGLARPDPTSAFCYVDFAQTDDLPAASRLASLSCGQREELWRSFLQSRVCPPELEWLWTILDTSGPPGDWALWFLSLMAALDQLHYCVEGRNGRLRVEDSQGRRLYFSVDHPSAGERVLMKLLFPLNL